jgi:geranylgeranyl diphosphate synthase type I
VDVNLDQYLVMIQHKTAALLAAAAQIGAIVAADDAGTIARFRSFGENLGMAFQIEDDILGIWGEEELTGKSAATDLRDRKKTLPIIHALSQGRGSMSTSHLAALYAQPEALTEEGIGAALAILESAHSRTYAEAMADRYLQHSLSSLVKLPSPAQHILADLARSLVGRRA